MTTKWSQIIKHTNSPKLRFKDVLEQDPFLQIKAQLSDGFCFRHPYGGAVKKTHFLARLGSLMLRYALVCLTGPKTPFWCRSANGPCGTREGQIKPHLCFDRSSVPKPLAAMRIRTYLPKLGGIMLTCKAQIWSNYQIIIWIPMLLVRAEVSVTISLLSKCYMCLWLERGTCVVFRREMCQSCVVWHKMEKWKWKCNPAFKINSLFYVHVKI